MKSEISQKKFKNEYQKAHNNILYTASWLSLQATKSLKPFNISPQQLNVLRVLHTFHPKPATVKILTERMIDEMSNASRLVEKLKQKGLVEREACDADRRRVNVYITSKGIELVELASKAIEKTVEEKMKLVDPEEIARLNNVLDQLRG